ncbi:zinc-dependent metalloprotease [Dinghuibacter silviterrae]|uniref:Uncharacterized protein DUF5118 n=1 Tax=Dinghuibacter silviterrae TaxID=1539049 RepID=A0A4R8DFQ1_9BACT|nr:zinc-dependent metalloprotease [Dinghuibacter silviterrae]TDW96267.1 uncharacterized protein DUF5118 [Dinghuibacter silviterrae]
MKYLVLIALSVAIGNARGQSARGLKPFDKVIPKDAVAWRGLFTVYQVGDSVYFEVPDSLLNRDMLVINRFVQMPYAKSFLMPRKYPGEENGETPCYFMLGRDSSINLCTDLLRKQAEPEGRLSAAVRQSTADQVVATFPIVAMGPSGKGFVISVSSFLKSSPVMSAKDWTGRGRSRLEYVHGYPVNVEIGMYQETGMGEIYVMNTSFIALPKTPMQQRIFDRRVGFFNNETFYFADNQQAVEKRDFIDRWRMEPRPEDRERWERGELVEPAKPIVYYIDPHTPKQWVKYLILGVNDWQKAFEQAGFKNAIMAKEWPYGDSVSLDDARYSFLCYLPSEVMNAYGPNTHDPRSGEIIQSHIGWYHNVMTLVDYWYRSQVGATDPAARRPVFDEELMGQLIRFVSSHEVGHTLGLRHNFGSSSRTPVEKMRDKNWLKEHGHTASIMDYARFNYVAQPEDSVPQDCLWPHIGEYDRWAIQWGYKYTGLNAEEDKKVLYRLASDSLAANPRLWFGSQEAEKLLQTDPPDDPRCQTEDLGDNDMIANAYGIKNLRRVLPNLPAWTKEQGGLYDNLDGAYKALLDEYKRFVGHVVNHIGGAERTYRSEDSGGDVYAPVPKEQQQQALAFLNEQLFTTPEWLLDPGVVNKIVVPGDAIGVLQRKTLKTLLGADKLANLLAASSQFGDSLSYPVQEYVADLHRYIWGGLSAGKKMDDCRRNLQKSYIDAMAALVAGHDPDISETDTWSVARADLAQIDREVKAALPKYTSEADQAHLQNVLQQIHRLHVH